MPRIDWTRLPKAVRVHLQQRVKDRSITEDNMIRLTNWIKTNPEVPNGEWCKDFGAFMLGQLELAAAGPGGAGECAFLVAEQFAFDQFGGDGGAIYFHERSRGEGAVLMDVRRQQFFAGAGFAD
jgi:hypothetical protein